MGVPRLSWRDIPMTRETDTLSFAVDVPGSDYFPLTLASAVNVGNPHVVLFGDDAENAPVAEIGPKIENHSLFPERTNVEFVSLTSLNTLRMRVWERGAGVTMACGTGAFEWVDLDSFFLLNVPAPRGGFKTAGPKFSVSGIKSGIGL